MSRRVTADEYEEQDGWIARLRDRWFGEGGEEDDEEFAPQPAPAVTPTVSWNPNSPGACRLLHHAPRPARNRAAPPVTLSVYVSASSS